MNINEAKKVVKFVMDIKEVPILVGHAGIGKTEIVKQIGKETGRDVVILMLSQMEPGDLLGFPNKDEKTGKTKYYAPDWFPTDGNTIVFLDEINRAHITVRNAVMQLLLDRRIHNNILPQGTWVIAAMNPETDDYEVEPIIDKAFIDRFVWIKVVPSYDEWRDFMLKEKRINADFEAAVNAIVSQDPSIFIREDFSIPDLPVTPRSLERLYKIVHNIPSEIKYLLNEIAYGVAGKVGVKIVKEMENITKAELSYKDLLSGNVEKVKRSATQNRVAALDAFMSYAINNENITEQEIANLVKCLKLYKKEELGPIFRVTSKEKQEVLKTLKTKSKEFREFFVDFIKSLGDIGTTLEKLS